MANTVSSYTITTVIAPPSGASATITVDRMLGAFQSAPEQIAFEVTGWTGFDTPGPGGATGDVYDARLHDFDYLWDFDDAGSVFTAPQKLPAVYMNANRAEGFRVSHIFREARTFNVSVLIIERSSGKTATVSAPVTVGSHDTAFPIANRVYVDPDSDFTWVPGEAATGQKLTSIAAMRTYVTANKPLWPLLVILRAGKTFPVSTISPRDGFGDVKIVSSDPNAALPEIYSTAPGDDEVFRNNRFYPNDNVQYSFVGIKYRTPFDVTSETGDGPAFLQSSVDNSGGIKDTRFQFIDCDFGDSKIPVQAPLQTPGVDNVKRFFMGNCIGSGSGQFIIFGAGLTFDFAGNRFAENPSALNGGPKGNGRNEHSGGFRLSLFEAFSCINHDTFCTSGWDTRSTVIQNTPMRVNTSSHPGARANIWGCIAEGGSSILSITESNSKIRSTGNYKVHKCFFIPSWSTFNAIVTDKPGTTVEDCMFYQPAMNLGIGGSQKITKGVTISDPQDQGLNFVYDGAPFNVRNNTLVIAGTDAQYNFPPTPLPTMVVDGSGISGIVISEINSLVHAPNLVTNPVTTYAPIAETVIGQARTSGYRVSWTRLELTLAAAVTSGNSATFPYPSGLGQSDFGAKPSQIVAAPSAMQGLSGGGNFTITFGVSDWTITNDSASTWASGSEFIIYLDHREGGVIPARNTDFATTADAIRYARPATGSSAIGAATGLVPVIDSLGNIRPGSAHPSAAVGSPSKGAIEPA